MKTLKDRLTQMIRTSGPISVADYMDICLHDTQQGYYTTSPGLGEDFITSPEISQVFGELIGLWAAFEWQQMGAPSRISLVEIGPGRGTLMSDALRASLTIPGFVDAVDLHFIEPSPFLKGYLKERFVDCPPTFLDQIDDIPQSQPFILLANEWLDCLPVQQYARVGEAWHQRVVGLNEAGDLTFGLSADPAPASLTFKTDQTSVELQPGLKTLAETLQGLLAQTRGRALFIDYGTTTGLPADTLRSYKAGSQIDPLAAPGESDLTADVDFARLLRLSEAQGLMVHGPLSQSRFLLSLGAEKRLNQLVQNYPDDADALYQAVRKLVDPAEMGERFQALCISRSDLPRPAAF
ncbi:MAG: SAM-dependent methyltransferase [Pseudomonadota bacterium]